ncbi:apolipoprotein D [Schistocerca americana]|uniref:apolipoprotein D n=1 Tax=Schistocerca americana TaxID=7009 RepID=UPI001F4F1396|nr:apolipoprotein D [Schistocerca americana]XP_047113910.1 apolipoprotein D [Schistocerca piceifrons]XP_049801172.1 apolipoprotein D [Schistocerca nitens]XP_049963562.1 apolipoprotein D [Schistocerca serialis cubense]
MRGGVGAGLGCGLLLAAALLAAAPASAGLTRRREDKTRCPQVKAVRDLDVHQMLGRWFVVQYYSSSEEALAYRCMRAELSLSPLRPEVSMNFTYSFTDDPDNELLAGNITWEIPDPAMAAHWVHAEDTYEGVYNTFVVNSDYKSWALLLHCAEKSKSPRYLSSFIMSRVPGLPKNVISYLREKLPRYDIDLSFMFPMQQDNCPQSNGNKKPPGISNMLRGHPLKHK